MGFQVAYVPIGVGTFHLESAQIQFDQSVSLLRSLTDAAVCPEKMLLTLDDLTAYLDGLSPDLVVLQNITFANAAYASEVLKRFSCPILLWTLREPVIDGGRLRLNSLTGAYSAANAIQAFRGDGQFEYVFGGPGEAEVQSELNAAIRAAKVKADLTHLKMASIGHTPQGFGFGRALDAEMMSVFGVTLESIEARELIDVAKGYTADDCAEELAEAKATLTGLDKTPEKNVVDFARLYKAYKAYVKDNGVGAISSRCWPDFFTSFGTPVCTVLSLLNANGTAASCESDAYGALSMYIGSQLSGKATFFGDPVSMDEEEGTVTFWHCGMAACSLARKDTGAAVGVHPNRKIGPTMDFGCQACDHVTIFRVGRKSDGTFRFFLAEGAALDKPKQFCGTSIVVKTDAPAKDVVYGSVKGGWEPHFVVIYDNVANELEKLGHMLQVEVCKF
ncbi:MAG: fucose isomerase [Clostridiales bacterium]|nr:fucose isomerase [Clostridiales bacterium]